MAVLEVWYRQNKYSPATVHDLKGTVFTMDNAGTLIGVEVVENNQPVSLSGSVVGYCVLANGTTVSIAGIKQANKAYITLPTSALSVPGRLNIVIKLVNGSEVTTLGMVIAYVFDTREGTIPSPSDQQITDWTNQITSTLAVIQGNSVRYDIVQYLNSTQKNRAKSNIGAIPTIVTLEDGDYKCIIP